MFFNYFAPNDFAFLRTCNMVHRIRRRRNSCIALLIIFSCWCLGCGKESEPRDKNADNKAPWFEEVASASGLDFEHVRARTIRYWLPEIMSAGSAWLDYDGDGDLDIYLVQGGDLDAIENPRAQPDSPRNRLYRNRGDGTLEDVTNEAGVGGRGYGMGCAVGDYDADGDVDLYVTNLGPDILYRNNGNGTFTDVTATAFSKTSKETGSAGNNGWGSSAAFVDYDDDGRLDLFVVNYVEWSPAREIECFTGDNERDYCHPSNYNAPAISVLYHNLGNGVFRDVTRVAGIAAAKGNGLGVTLADFNQDGRVDIYVANDDTPSHLWINHGDGTFAERALLTGCAVNLHGAAEAGMGVMAFDLENDGDLDLFKTHLREETNIVYRNRNGVFDDITALTGLGAPSLPFTGFGTGFADFDHDGEMDVYVVNGRVTRAPTSLGEDPYGEPNQLFQGLGNSRFEEVFPQGGTSMPFIETSRAAAFGDYDGDGDVDILIANNGGPARLLKNRASSRGNWIMFRVLNRHGLDAVGAMIGITTSTGKQWRLVQVAYSYLASNDPRAHFGLGGADKVENVVVNWPGGRSEFFGSFPAGKVHLLREGAGHRRTM
jgi:hypothetical protein